MVSAEQHLRKLKHETEGRNLTLKPCIIPVGSQVFSMARYKDAPDYGEVDAASSSITKWPLEGKQSHQVVTDYWFWTLCK